MTITDLTAVFGLVFGLLGSLLGLSNYLRDRPRVSVNLLWDMTVTDNPQYDPSKHWGVIQVANIGRRPVYISSVILEVPFDNRKEEFLIEESLQGFRLSEGDPPKVFIISQDNMHRAKSIWKEVRASVRDVTGKVYQSKLSTKALAPSWAT